MSTRSDTRKMLRLLVGLASANLVLMGVVIVLLLTGGLVPAPAASPGVVSTVPTGVPTNTVSPSKVAATGAPPGSVAELLHMTTAPLISAGKERSIDVAPYLPTAEEQAAILKAGSLGCPAGETVVAKLTKGHEALGMPMPRLPMTSPSSGAAPLSPTATSGADPKAVETWLVATLANLNKAAADKGVTVTLPTKADQAAAVASGTFDSDQTRQIMGPIREAYDAVGMDFPEPGGAPPADAAGPPGSPGAPATDGLSEQQKILRAFFTVRAQELQREATAAGKDATGLMPDSALIDAAIASGEIRSDASRVVLDRFAESYEGLGLTWRDPVGR